MDNKKLDNSHLGQKLWLQYSKPPLTINPEIKALLQLIEDPDEEVFASVSEQIISFGKPIIPNLEHLWETESDPNTQDRIERLIHDLHFTALKNEMTCWANDSHDLLTGALLASKYLFPDVSTEQTCKEIEKIRRSIWLELNNYLTPIEKITVVNSILFNYFKLRPCETEHATAKDFALTHLLAAKTGNSHSLRLLYLILCQQLDIDVKAVDIPQQTLMAYYITDNFDQSTPQLLFYIDPTNGQLYSVKDVEHYLKKVVADTDKGYNEPLDNLLIIAEWLNTLSQKFESEETAYRQKELQLLAELLTVR